MECDRLDVLSNDGDSDTEGAEFEGDGAFDGPEDDDPSRRARA
jgi:hypothetical protein